MCYHYPQTTTYIVFDDKRHKILCLIFAKSRGKSTLGVIFENGHLAVFEWMDF